MSKEDIQHHHIDGHNHTHDHGHNHSHGLGGHHHHGPDGGKGLVWSVVLNLGITAIQIAGGLLSGSLALLSDAVHNFTDVFFIAISYIALKLSKRKSDAKRTFGYKRTEILAALINSVLLVSIFAFLFVEAIRHLFHPEPIKALIVIIAALAGIILNGSSAFLLKGHAEGSLNIKAAYLHLLSDMLSSIAVLIGGIAIYFFKDYAYWIDPVLTIAIGLYVLKDVVSVIKETINILMHSTPTGVDIEAIKIDLEAIPQVKNLHHVHIWNLNEKEVYFEGHIDFEKDYPLSEVDKYRKEIEKILKSKHKIQHVTLQTEYNYCENKDLIRNEAQKEHVHHDHEHEHNHDHEGHEHHHH